MGKAIDHSSIEQLKHCAQRFLGSEACGHDFLHCLRVANLATRIAEEDFPQADMDVLRAAAVVHDICRPWERKTGKSHFGKEALQIIDGELSSAGFSAEPRQQILEIVRWHDVYDPSAIPNLTVELKIHQDADRLEAMGAIGIARAFSFGGAHGRPIYTPGEKLTFESHFIDSPDHRTSSIAHFYEKLFKLRDQMHTPTGRKLAEERHRRMERFVGEFFEEWGSHPFEDVIVERPNLIRNTLC